MQTTEPRPVAKLSYRSSPTPRYTTGAYLDANPDWHDTDAPWKADQIVALLAQHPIRLATMCDIGCGTGGVLASLQRRLGGLTTAVGYEVSPQAATLARHLHPEIQVVPRAIEAEDGPYDVALVLDVFEHVEDHFAFLRGLHGVATHYLFHIPLDMFALHLLFVNELLENRRELGHLHYFCPDTARTTLEETGFEVIASRYTASSLADPHAPRSSKLLRPLRRAGIRLAPELTARMLGGFSLLVLATDAEGHGSSCPGRARPEGLQ